MLIFTLVLSFYISLVEGKSIKSLRFKQVGVPRPNVPADVIPDDSEDPNHYYVIDFNRTEDSVAVYDVWYDFINSDMSWIAFSDQGSEQSLERSISPSLNALQSTMKDAIFGNVDSDIVENTENFPWDTIGLIRYKSGGEAGGCTGALVSDRVVLTTADCLYNSYSGEFYHNFTFAPGATAQSQPYGEYKYEYVSVKLQYSREQEDRYDYRSDFGLMLLEDAPPVGHMPFGYSCNLSVYVLNFAGYPDSKNRPIQLGPFDMYWDYCEGMLYWDWYLDGMYWDGYLDYSEGGYTEIDICPSSAVSVVYDVCDTYRGMSGSPMWIYYNSSGKRYIRAVHQGTTADVPKSIATFITPHVYDFIKDFINEREQ